MADKSKDVVDKILYKGKYKQKEYKNNYKY